MSAPSVSAPLPSPEELALQREQLSILQEQRGEQAALRPFQLTALGLTQTDDGLRRLTDEERLAGLTPGERQLEEARGLQGERLIAALRGELPIDPAFERSRDEQRQRVLATLAQRGVGPGDTAFAQTVSQFDAQTEALREAQRRGEISGGTGLFLEELGAGRRGGQQEFAGLGAFGERQSGLFGRFGEAQQPFQFQRNLQLQASVQNAQSQGAFLGGVGQVLGTGLGFALGGPVGAAIGGGLFSAGR